MRRTNHTRLIVICLWAVLASIQIHELSVNACPVEKPAPDCESNQYLEGDTCTCKNCTNCAELGQFELNSCTSSRNAVCQNCTICKVDEWVVAACTSTEDTRCQHRCQSHQYYVPEENRCHFKCTLCQYGCVTSGTTRCQCYPSVCYAETDILCDTNLCTSTTAPPTEVTGTVDSKSNELPTWGIGLISIGVVIGIVAFSAGSMILSFCTRRTSQIDDEEEINSTGDFKPVLIGQYSSGHPGPFLHLPSQQKNKYSPNSPRTSSASSSIRSGSLRGSNIRNSPKAVRSMQVPRPENATPI